MILVSDSSVLPKSSLKIKTRLKILKYPWFLKDSFFHHVPVYIITGVYLDFL